ncbi:MAG: ATP12 family protein, partial [Pseudomonadota bacterium]|nr:ATP12 family protein [Pseudomonadota bacterium]
MKRFYREVAVHSDAEGHFITLDGRAIKTQGGRPQRVPARALA